MWGQLQQSAKVGWVGAGESAVADLSFDYFIMYGLGFLAASIFVCWCLIIQLQLYQMLPGWGPIRKFDADGTEEMRINQLLIHEEKQGVGHNLKGDTRKIDENVAFLQGMLGEAHGEMMGLKDKVKDHGKAMMDKHGIGNGQADEEEGQGNQNGLYNGFQQTYGTIGACTWGYCESPSQWGEPKFDPRVGRDVVVRHGFADTQWMRQHSRTWARDEPYWQQYNGMSHPPLTLQDNSAINISQRMAIERGGF